MSNLFEHSEPVVHQASFANGTPRCWNGKSSVKKTAEIPLPTTTDNWRNVTCPACIQIRRLS